MFGDEEERDVVDVCGELERGGVLFQHGAGAHDPGVGDHQVEPARDPLHLGGHRGDGFLIGDVHCDGVGEVRSEFRAFGGGPVAVEIGDEDETALVDKALGDFRAETLRAASNQGDATADLAFTARGGGDLVGLLPQPHHRGQ